MIKVQTNCGATVRQRNGGTHQLHNKRARGIRLTGPRGQGSRGPLPHLDACILITTTDNNTAILTGHLHRHFANSSQN